MPHKHYHVLGLTTLQVKRVRAAIQAALKAKEEWENTGGTPDVVFSTGFLSDLARL